MMDTLYRFWINCCAWYTENQQAITTFFMSGQFISLIAAITMLVRNVKQVKSNTDSTIKLDGTLTNTNKMSEKIDSLEKSVVTLTAYNDSLTAELDETRTELQESNAMIVDKLNAIIEVQSIVYTTIRDDSIRRTVNTILNNARYSEKNFKEQLETQIESLKTEFDQKMAEVNESMTNTINKVANSVNSAENAKNRAKKLRGIEDAPTRY